MFSLLPISLLQPEFPQVPLQRLAFPQRLELLLIKNKIQVVSFKQLLLEKLNLVVKMLVEENHFVLDQKVGLVKEVKQQEQDGNVNNKKL